MSSLAKFRVDVFLVVPGGRDRYGEPLPDSPAVKVPGCLVAPQSSSEDQGPDRDLGIRKAFLSGRGPFRLPRTGKVLVPEPHPMAGEWEIAGEPDYWTAGFRAPLKQAGAQSG